MKPGTDIQCGAYRGHPVGQGGFATVYRVTNPGGQTFALKLVDEGVDESIRQSLYHEFSIQSQLVHPQVVHAHEFGLHAERPYVVLDWIDGIGFFDQYPEPSEEDFVTLLRQLARVLFFVHHRGWVHGDLKPENFLWRKPHGIDSVAHPPELCLLDFGLARPIGDSDRPVGAGTVGYCAPEFLNSQPADGRADWYSVGIMLYEWIFGVRPYASEEPALEVAGHREGAPDFSHTRLRQAPEWADEVIARLLAKTAGERGDDEIALLNWMAEFDPELDPTGLLNQLLGWHAKSESLRLRSNEQALLDILSDELASGQAVIWSIDTHGSASPAFMSRASGLCSSFGYTVVIAHESETVSTLSDPNDPSQSEPRVHIRWHDSQARSESVHGIEPLRSVSLSPWDRQEVREYIRGIVGDEDVALAWVDTVYRSTCGLPAAVQELVTHLISFGDLSVDGDGWGLNDNAVKSWVDRRGASHVCKALGELNDSERELCEWLALGQGVGSLSVVRRLWSDTRVDLDGVLAVLALRGVVVRRRELHSNEFDLSLRLTGHDAIIRSAMTLDHIQTRSRALAESIDEAAVKPAATRGEVLGHAYARAGNWAKSAEECLRAASFAIKADNREQAIGHISMAQESAMRIEDLTARSHWMGHARMVEGDVQKAAGQLDIARQIYRELLGLCRQTGDKRLLGETLHDLGDLYYITRRHHKGIWAERQALRIWQDLDDREQISRSLNSLGNLHRLVGDYPKALEFYGQAIEIQHELGLEKFAATNLNNIGLIHWLQNDFVQASSCFREALAIQESLNAPVEIARVLNNLGALCFVQGMIEESEQYFRRAAQLNADAGAQGEALFNRWNLVETALESGDLRTTVTTGQVVHQECTEIGEHATASEVAALLADAYDRAGDDHRAQAYYDDCRRALATLKNDDLQVHLELHQVARHIRLRNHQAALDILESVCPIGKPLASRYRHLDSLILRAQVAVAVGDVDTLARVWELGSADADAIVAPQKKAQLAAVCLMGNIDRSRRSNLSGVVQSFLAQRPRWHWTSSYHLWVARQSVGAGDWDEALRQVTDIVQRLRKDGQGDLLWRALVLEGEIQYALADYEPSMSALDEAANLLKVIASTVDNEDERASYIDCDEVRTLDRIKESIAELVT